MKKLVINFVLFFNAYLSVFNSYGQGMPASRNQLVIISHRGNHIDVPENTLAAYEAAIKSEADYVEIDLRTSKDGFLVIQHDATVDRMTDGLGKVSEKSLEELKKLKVKSNSSTDTALYQIPEFREVLKLCKNRINIYLDFKEADVAQTWKQIQEEGMEKQVVVYLNRLSDYKKWREANPQIPLITGLLDQVKTKQQLRFFLGQGKIEALDNIEDKELIQAAQEEGVAVWLDVQSPTEGPKTWMEALQKGVNGIQTDHPKDLINYLKTNGWRDGMVKNNLKIAQKPTYQSLLDVRYGDADGKDNLLDAYYPDNHNENTKVIVYIHGGSWSRGDKSEFPKQLIDDLVGQKGYMLISINYRLVKDGKNLFPAQIEDVQKAITFISSKAKRYGFDGNQFTLMGGSAGAHLALLYAYKYDTKKQVKTVINLWGATDLTDKAVRADGSDANNTVINFLGNPDPESQICIDASPLRNLTKENAVPTISFHGVEDPLVNVSQAENLHKKLQSLGVLSQLELYPNEKHGMSPVAAIDVFAKMIAWLEKQYPAK